MICPSCKGFGKLIIPFPHNRNKPTMTCYRCSGKKEVSDETSKWMAMGEILKNRRIEKKITLRDASKLLNIEVVKLSQMETGCIEPDLNIEYF